LGEGFGKKISKVTAGEEISFSGEMNTTPTPAKETSSPAVYDEDLATSHGKLAIIDEEGVSFTSHVDGTLHRFTPERSIEIQHGLGADIIYSFDECTSPRRTMNIKKRLLPERTAGRPFRSRLIGRNIKKNAEQGIIRHSAGRAVCRPAD